MKANEARRIAVLKRVVDDGVADYLDLIFADIGEKACQGSYGMELDFTEIEKVEYPLESRQRNTITNRLMYEGYTVYYRTNDKISIGW